MQKNNNFQFSPSYTLPILRPQEGRNRRLYKRLTVYNSVDLVSDLKHVLPLFLTKNFVQGLHVESKTLIHKAGILTDRNVIMFLKENLRSLSR